MPTPLHFLKSTELNKCHVCMCVLMHVSMGACMRACACVCVHVHVCVVHGMVCGMVWCGEV